MEFPSGAESVFSAQELAALRELLAEDPRPQYQDDPERVYGLLFCGHDVRFKVSGTVLAVLDIKNAPQD